jgi:hypothetical protein
MGDMQVRGMPPKRSPPAHHEKEPGGWLVHVAKGLQSCVPLVHSS